MSEPTTVGRESPVIYAIGHSTRSLEEFAGLLGTYRSPSYRAAPPHTLTEFARVDDGKVSDPSLT
jgi:hypothetical protein